MPRKNKKERLSYQRQYQNNWYQKNKERRKSQNLMSYYRHKEWFMKVKANYKCKECGENHPATIDFHHRDKNSKFEEVSDMIAQMRSRESILAEIEKCDALCSNCHRKLHWLESQLQKEENQKRLVEKHSLFPSLQKHTKKLCKFCGTTNETEKWRTSKVCIKCYNFQQRETMKNRRDR